MVEVLIENALSPLGYRVEKLVLPENEETYFCYQIYLKRPAVHASRKPSREKHYIRVDLYDRMGVEGLLKRAEQALRAAGFSVTSSGPERYDNETKYYQVPIMAEYASRVEGG